MKTKLEGDSQGSEEQLLHLHKMWRIKEVQAVISQKHDEGKVNLKWAGEHEETGNLAWLQQKESER